MTTHIARTDPTAETVRNMVPPARSGVSYVAERYIVAELSPGNADDFAFAIQNPEGVNCVITNVIVDVSIAGGTAASVLDVDVVSSAADTGDKIIDGLDLNTTGAFDRHDNAGTNGGSPVHWDKRGGANDWLTGKVLDADAASLTGQVVISFIPLD